ncbi:MAG: glutathione S-transferase family protein [Sphingomonadales bacterium]|nr:glutathione S-transferase family protein [Sphingomonadales bacterium]
MITIWGHENAPNVRKVIWTCEELRLRYERKDIGGPFGGVDSQSYRALNPNGRIPTITHDGFVLWESHAIMRYLVAITDGQALVPAGPQGQARVNQWMDWQLAHLGHAIRALVVLVLKPGDTVPTPAQIDAARMDLLALLAILDTALTERSWILGEAFTLADIPLAINYNMWKVLAPDHEGFPALEDWYARIMARPAYKPLPAKGAARPAG